MEDRNIYLTAAERLRSYPPPEGQYRHSGFTAAIRRAIIDYEHRREICVARTIVAAAAMAHPALDVRKTAEVIDALWDDLKATVPYWGTSPQEEQKVHDARLALIEEYQRMFGEDKEDT